MKERLLKINRIYWIAAAVVVIAVVGLVIWNINSSRTTRSSSLGQRYTVTRGTFTQSISGTGAVHASQSAVLTWQTTGKVGAVTVGIGDKVAADQVLATLEQSSLPQAIIQAEVDLVNAQISLAQATQSNTGKANAEQAVATAQKALQDAQKTLDSQNFPRASDSLINKTSGQIVLAQKQLARATDAYRAVQHLADDNSIKAQALINMTTAQLNLNTLIANINWYTGSPTSLDQAQAQAARDVAQAQLQDAQRTLASYNDGSVSVDLVTAQAKVAIAQATLNEAKIMAPFPGVITEADATAGDLVSPTTTAFRIDNTSHLLVNVSVSEVDIDQVKLGMPVTMQFDAIPNKTYNGKIVKVNLAGDVASNAVTFTITAELTDANEQVKPGMSANVTIIVKQVQNALLVPNRAIVTANGVHTVQVFRNGQVSSVQVQVGATSDTVSEVLSGLSEGDSIVFAGTSGTPAAGGAFRTGGGGGGGGGGAPVRIP